MSDAPVLEARNITRRFGTFTALDQVNFAVGEGEIVALLGENGAGKSTLMNLLSGLLAPTDGTILMDGRVARFASPTDATARGIGMVHQHFLLVPTISVAENLLLSASRRAGGSLSYPLKLVLKEAQILAGRLGWTIPWDKMAGDLPVGTQQRVEILKALRGQTRILIFDEPTAVLTPTETPELFATIRRLAAEGRGIVFISHKLDEVLSLSERVTVLRRGKVVFNRETVEVNEAMLAEAMVGKDSEAAGLLREAASVEYPSPPGTQGVPGGEGYTEIALQLTNVSLRRADSPRPLLDGISFAVAPGEIFGIAGVDGNGQEELAGILSGLLRPSGGTVRVGKVEPAPDAGAFRRAGVAVIPADRQARGLAMPLTITENIALGAYDDARYRRGPVLLWGKLRERADTLIRGFDIRATGASSPVRDLSGGNQQKVVIARALSTTPKVIIAVNPTRGLDVGAIAYVHNALRQAQSAGAAVVLISTELSEVLTLTTHSVGVLYEGRFTGVVAPTTPRDRIGLLMGGSSRE
ncbi:MAG: ABC transporter ATP-binding protein [Akkermansiaceae bacterium]|nr:ABC transporter ATP-binding protein [Armatimonadota bacterium]